MATTRPLFGSRTVAALRALAERGLLAQGVGGDTWTVTRAIGSGLTPGAPTVIGTICAAVFQDTKAAERGALPATAVTVAPWKVGVFAHPEHPIIALQANDLLTSATTPSMTYTVVGPDSDVIYAQYLLKVGR